MPVQNIEHRLVLEPTIQCALFIGQEGLAGGFATPSRKPRRSNIGHSVSCSPHRHPVCAHDWRNVHRKTRQIVKKTRRCNPFDLWIQTLAGLRV